MTLIFIKLCKKCNVKYKLGRFACVVGEYKREQRENRERTQDYY